MTLIPIDPAAIALPVTRSVDISALLLGCASHGTEGCETPPLRDEGKAATE